MKNVATCQETRECLQEFMDASLAPDREGRLRAHFESCPACAGELALQREVRSRVAAEVPRREVPAALRRKVQEMMAPKEGRLARLLPWPIPQWGMAVAALLLISLIPIALWTRGHEEGPPPILVEAVNDHIRLAMKVNPRIGSTADRLQVRRWLEPLVGFHIDPPPGETGGLRFIGGDATYFLEQKVACLLYGKGEKLVTLFVLPQEGVAIPRHGFRRLDGLEVYVGSQKGYGMVLWKKGTLLYSVVSELPQEDLLGVVKEMAQI
ncbi:MAG: anti-sigma factor family protein [Candidatus Methylomirabilales bacterium]